jgi:hypothetical protein
MDDELHRWSVTVTLPEPVQEIEVELFGAARPGWTITTEKEEVIGSGPGSFKAIPLRSFEAGHQYRLTSGDDGPEGSSAPMVTFTTDDLSKLGEGGALAAVDGSLAKMVSRESFIHQRCG